MDNHTITKRYKKQVKAVHFLICKRYPWGPATYCFCQSLLFTKPFNCFSAFPETPKPIKVFL